MTNKFQVGDDAVVVSLHSEEFDTSLSKFDIEVGDTAKILSILEYDDGSTQYAAEVYRNGELVEKSLSLGESELGRRCDENHELVYHDTEERYFCPFCRHSEEVFEER